VTASQTAIIGGVSAGAVHLHPTAPLAPRALLPGDPGRALALATALLGAPRMFNHNRGLWGYTGIAEDGAPLTIQSTGIGGPSAAIVLEELIALGLERAIRVGTAGALAPSLALGELVIATEAICADGTSRALGSGEREGADAAMVDALRRCAPGAHAGTIVTSDLFYEDGTARLDAWRAAGALAVEMEAAALLATGRRRGVAIGCVLALTDALDGQPRRLGPEERREAGIAAGRVGAAALGALG
jgi:uridine phosphorylase